jgi:hypothetical protein
MKRRFVKMQSFSAIGIFCEDIRQEQSGQDIIIGTFPDNVNIPSEPASTGATTVFPKLGLYVRVNFDVGGAPPTRVSVRLELPDGSSMAADGWDDNTIRKAFSDAKANQMPLVGLILKFVFTPFPIRQDGKLTAIVNVDGSDYVAGAINLIAKSANASAPSA